MTSFRKVLLCAALAMAGTTCVSLPTDAQTGNKPAAPSYRDGSHDFDFHVGTWRTHIKTLQHPLSGSHDWTELDGTVTVRKIMDGKAELEEIDASGPSGHLQGLTLFLYNPQSHQWSQTFASTSDGTLETPAIGEFKDGRGELIDQEPFNGRTILVRNAWSDIKPDSQRFEIAYSDDHGKTWEPNFVANLTRISR
ncbi:hypothetical protein [Dyella mobilis]|uniref:DUF1579 domain-containing protein n=1 Tax=Dyella mobilis TaxID=1849582 RepID=A0ABS2KJR3_9GAMM|nr:hypothetical protein [Dyella mobilis]MBM7131391.1 hypothetical protein [Dyella mobilis]GLQ96637.1 hypothetical protein GCM10007863_10550 [Dyella mobilis]